MKKPLLCLLAFLAIISNLSAQEEQEITDFTISTSLPTFVETTTNTIQIQSNEYIENTDYFVKVEKKSPELVNVMHIQFTLLVPNKDDAGKILKNHLLKYGKSVKKNVLGSIWYKNIENKQFVKLSLDDKYSTLVWVEKEKKIIPFTEYVKYLKKQKELDKEKAKKAALNKSLNNEANNN